MFADIEDAQLQHLEETKRDYQESLAWLMSPDYIATENPDDEFRDHDIDHLNEEIRQLDTEICRMKKKKGNISS